MKPNDIIYRVKFISDYRTKTSTPNPVTGGLSHHISVLAIRYKDIDKQLCYFNSRIIYCMTKKSLRQYLLGMLVKDFIEYVKDLDNKLILMEKKT